MNIHTQKAPTKKPPPRQACYKKGKVTNTGKIQNKFSFSFCQLTCLLFQGYLDKVVTLLFWLRHLL